MESAPRHKSKEYVRPVPATWWLKRPAYLKFMIREITGVFLAGYAVFLMVLMLRARDAAAFSAFLEDLKSPLSIALHLVVLFFAFFHSVTFFDLTPRVLRVYRGEERVPDALVAGAHYVAWAIVSAALLVLAIRG